MTLDDFMVLKSGSTEEFFLAERIANAYFENDWFELFTFEEYLENVIK